MGKGIRVKVIEDKEVVGIFLLLHLLRLKQSRTMQKPMKMRWKVYDDRGLDWRMYSQVNQVEFQMDSNHLWRNLQLKLLN